MLQKDRFVYLILCSVILIWGLNVIMVKYLSFFPPVLIAALRMTIAAIVLLPWLWWKKQKVKLSRIDWLYILAVALTSITFHQILITWGIQYTTAGNASLILALNPLVTILLAAPYLREPLTWRKFAGVVLGFLGVLLVVTNSGEGEVSWNGWGDFLVFLSMMLYAIGGLFIRKGTSRGIPVLVITVYPHVIASIILWLIAFTLYPSEVFTEIDSRPFTWFVILASGVFATALCTVGWNYGLRQLGAGRTSLFLNGIPISSLIFATLLLGETLKVVHVVALLMIVAGVCIGSQHITVGRQRKLVSSTLHGNIKKM